MNKYGTGIGLFTANNIVAQMGPCEKMFISSEEGKGSKFSFFIY
jgi:signal transduction histidine kinase